MRPEHQTSLDQLLDERCLVHGNIVATCRVLEASVHALVAERVLGSLGIDPPSPADEDAYVFRYNYRSFRLVLGRNTSVPSQLDVALHPLVPTEPLDNPRTATETSRFSSTGRYTAVRVTCGVGLMRHAATLCDAAVEVVQFCYRWLRTSLDRDILDHRSSLSSSIYDLFRLHLPQAADQLHLYAICEGRSGRVGRYVPDVAAQQHMLDGLERTRGTRALVSSPAETLSLFRDTELPSEATYTLRAVESDTTVHGHFPESVYRADPIVAAEIAMYDSETNSVQPLIRQGNMLLAVGYPRQLRESVEGTLKRLIPDITELVRASSGPLVGKVLAAVRAGFDRLLLTPYRAGQILRGFLDGPGT